MKKMPQSSILVLLTFALSMSVLKAQQEQDSITFQHIQNGMSQSSASIIYEDSDGFIWTGTSNGLNKFDGSNFKVFEKTLDGVTGLTEGYIGSIYENGDTLYIGTNQGLNIYDRSRDIVRPYKFKHEGKQISSKHIISIEKTNDLIWLGTYSDGLYRYDTNSGESQQFLIKEALSTGKNKNSILKVAQLDADRLVVISRRDIFVIDRKMEILAHQQEATDISSVADVDENNFLLGTKNGSVIELKVNQNSELHSNRIDLSPGFVILSLAVDQHGDIWAGAENNGLLIYTKSTKKITQLKPDSRRPNSLSSNSIWSLMSAQNGVMWMAPFKKGLSFYDSKYYKFDPIQVDPFNSKSLNNNIVNCFLEDTDGNLWVGTDGGGLNYWNRSSNTFDHYTLSDRNFGSNVVLSLLETKNDELWAGTWANGLTIFNTKTKKYETWNTENSFLASDNVIGLLQDQKGRIWIATLFGGLQIYYPETKTHKNITLKSHIDDTEVKTVARILEDTNGNIWAGSQSSGLFRLTENEGIWNYVHYHNMHSDKAISNVFVNTIVQDKNGTIWVGTQAGLNKYLSDTDSFEAITKLDGLKNDAIKGIIADKGDFLWLSTARGIARFNPETGETIDYDVDDGLQSSEFNGNSFYTTTKGEFIFGGGNGFNIFKAGEVEKREDKPTVYISGLKIFNQPVHPNDDFGVLDKDISQVDTLILNYDHAVVNFDFKALTYRHPDKVNYAYFLEGFETEWNYVGNTASATYTNLNPGDYSLRIKSSNSDGVWNNDELRLAIAVTPPFWKTLWFRVLFIATLLGCTYLFYYQRVRNIKRHQVTLEQEIHERTKELQSQKKKLAKAAEELADKNEEIQRFTFAVSHDLKSPLNSIEMMAGLISKDIGKEKFPDATECLKYITKSCAIMKSLIADITEIARLGKIENKNEILDSKEIIQTASNMAIGRFKEKKAQLIIGPGLPKVYGDRNRLIQVFENLIDNAIKYMGDQKDPLVEVKSKVSSDCYKFFVTDNGSGMDERALKRLFTPFQRFDAKTEGTGLGLYMIKKIIESHHGTITAESEGKGKGTTFVVTLPFAKAA